MSSTGPIHYEELPNGLVLLLRESHLAPVVNLQIWAQVGSADERPEEAGLAHFHEHMLFKGTERRGVGEVAGEVEGAGGRINAYTSFDVTVYHATLPRDAMATGLDVLSDAVLHSTFDPDEVAREREVVLEEIRRSEDSPGHVLSDAVFHEAYRVHPYRAPILGTPESVASFSRESVTSFFGRWYAPDNLVVVAAGDFDPKALAEQIKAVFGDRQGRAPKRSRPQEPRHEGLHSAVLQRHFEGVRADLTWPAARFRDADATYLDLLSFILGEAESSRLVRKIKERDTLVKRIDSSCYTPFDPGLFSVNFEVEADQAARAIEAISAEIERLRMVPVSADEFERARANFLATEQFERESASGLASKLGSFHVLGGDWQGEEHYFETLRAATPEDLLRVAEQYLDPAQLTVGMLYPESEKQLLDHASIGDAVTRGAEKTRRALAAPKCTATAGGAAKDGAHAAGRASAGAGRAAQRDAPLYSYQLANGAELHVVPRREVPVVAGRAAFGGGLLAESEANAGISHFLSSMWLRGTKSRSAADFARAVENLAAEIDGFSGRSSLGLTFESTTAQLEPTLDLFAEVLLEPELAPEEVEREQRDTLAAIQRWEDHLAQQSFQLFGETLFREHPYRLPMIGKRASVEAFDSANLRAYHDRLIRAGNVAIAVAGDVDPDEIAEALSQRLVELPGGAMEATIPGDEAAPDSIRRVERKKEREQAHLVIGFKGLAVDDEDRYGLEVISQLLAGQGGRLFLELRDKASLAYSVNAINVEGKAPGFFCIYIGTAPEKVDEARSGILEQLQRLVDEPPGADELQHTLRYLTGNYLIDQQRNATHAAHVSLDALYGLGPEAHRQWAEKVATIGPEDVMRVARRVLKLDAYTEALVHP